MVEGKYQANNSGMYKNKDWEMNLMKISIPYADSYKIIEVDESKIKGILSSQLDEFVPDNNESEIVKNALHNPIGSGRLCDIVVGIYCKIETDKVAKKIPQFCNYEFPTIAKGH